MKILVLNGSPRNKNTAALCKGFTAGAEAAGHEVKEFKVAKMNISPCRACEYCHTKGGGVCAIKDDWVEVRAAFDEADMVVLASPVYYFAITGQLQSAVSRFYAGGGENAKKFALILSSASPDVYTGAKAQFNDIIKWYKAKNMGEFAFQGDIDESCDYYEQIKSFGASL